MADHGLNWRRVSDNQNEDGGGEGEKVKEVVEIVSSE